MADRAFLSGAVGTPPSAPVPPSIGYPIGIGPLDTTTKIGEYWFYMMTEEVRNVILMGGVAPDHLQVNQMALAIQNAIAASAGTKSSVGHVHSISEVTNLQSSLNTLTSGLASHTHYLLVNGAGTAVLDSGGNLTTTGNVTGFSDIRLKTEIEVIEDALAKVRQIRGVTFKRIDFPESPRMAGVIAQEVQAVQPELVLTSPSGKLSVAYGNMVGLLVEAIKDLAAEVDSLKAKVERNDT